MEAWGAAALAMAVEAGLVGAGLLAAVLALRLRPARRSGLLLLGLVGFLVPTLLTVPGAGTVLRVQMDGGPAAIGTDALLSAVAWAQVGGLAVGTALLVRSRRALGRHLERAEHVREGPLLGTLDEIAADQGVATPRLFLTEDVGPAAVGLVRPSVLLPRSVAESLDDRALRMVLAHEVAHGARHDPLVGALRRAALSAWWFHPVAWILGRMHRAAAEDACDDVAVGDGDPSTYCRALLAAARGRAPLAVGAGLGEHSLARRFRRLHGTVPRSGQSSRLARMLAAAAGAAALLAAPLGLPAPTADGGADAGRQMGEHVHVVEHVHVIE